MELRRRKVTQFLPVEIIIIILSFLPAKIAMRFRLVCKSWRDFVDSHFKNSFPSILVSNLRSDSGLLDLFTLDKWWELSQSTMLTVHRFPLYSGKFDVECRPLFSHGGLLVLEDEEYMTSLNATFFILNPSRPSHEHVRITLSRNLSTSEIYGVYFHPSLKEYCSLWKIIVRGRRIKRIHYKVLSLGSNPSIKTISNPFSNRNERNCTGTPLFFNNYLYWLIEPEQEVKFKYHKDIMGFDIVKEEFMVIPCPVPLTLNTECDPYKYRTCLLNIDGILSFLLIVPSKISIWSLEDHAQQLWTASEYTLNIPYDYPQGIAVVDGKLALLSERRLVVCDLKEGTVKKYPKRNMYCDSVSFLSHKMSLASLKKCKSKISIEKGDEEVVVRASSKSNYRAPYAGMLESMSNGYAADIERKVSKQPMTTFGKTEMKE